MLGYDAVRQASAALLAAQGLRATTLGGHVALERTVRAQFGSTFEQYGGLRRRRNEIEYPAHPDDDVDLPEATDALTTATTIVEAAASLLPHLGPF